MKRTVRLRLTLVYTGLFLVTGVVLIALIYLLATYLPFPGGLPQLPGFVDPFSEQRAGDLRSFLITSSIALVVMAFVSMVLGWLMAGRVLRPLATMTATVRRISADDLSRRLAAPGPDDELKELADTFDELLGRLEGAFEAQRRFVANASHELRTPLTLQQAMVEVTLADPDADAVSMRATLGRLLAAGRHQERLIEALLTLARSQQGLRVRTEFDLAAITHELVPEGQDLAAAPMSGDPELVRRLVANLLDNATHHNVPGGWVRVSTGMESGVPTLHVANSGQLIPADQIPILMQPFRRLGGDRKASGDGLGLGLSIVAAITDAHHGTLTARPLKEGGLHVSVSFPHSAPRSSP